MYIRTYLDKLLKETNLFTYFTNRLKYPMYFYPKCKWQDHQNSWPYNLYSNCNAIKGGCAKTPCGYKAQVSCFRVTFDIRVQLIVSQLLELVFRWLLLMVKGKRCYPSDAEACTKYVLLLCIKYLLIKLGRYVVEASSVKILFKLVCKCVTQNYSMY